MVLEVETSMDLGEIMKFWPKWKWTCPYCGKDYKTQRGGEQHMIRYCKKIAVK